ncbi:DUF3203 family protein [Pseudomonas alkylphenolica]|uniref:DUF3203 family protein n=1 Tax=Pseudomonas alkylphenolica TaxID=237609 RepID=A0A6I6HDZ4_9PSED|nr:DUF3203 family protein [Pseudomonas alkylphenolica]
MGVLHTGTVSRWTTRQATSAALTADRSVPASAADALTVAGAVDGRRHLKTGVEASII